jgi:hypothetical protein
MDIQKQAVGIISVIKLRKRAEIFKTAKRAESPAKDFKVMVTNYFYRPGAGFVPFSAINSIL